jgi:hypothetical protein
VLQKLELQNERRAADTEIAGFDSDDRGAPDIGADQPLGRFDPGSVDQAAVEPAQNCTFPSEGGRAGGRCTAGRVTFGRGGGIGRMAAGCGAVASGGGSGMRGIVSQPPGISSACAVAPRDSAAIIESAIAATNIETFCISDATPILHKEPAAYDNPARSGTRQLRPLPLRPRIAKTEGVRRDIARIGHGGNG